MQEIARSEWVHDLIKDYAKNKSARPRAKYCEWLGSLVKDCPMIQEEPLTPQDLHSIIQWALVDPPSRSQREEFELSQTIIDGRMEQGSTLKQTECIEGVQCHIRCPFSKFYGLNCKPVEIYPPFLKEAFTEEYPIAVAVFFLHMSTTVRGNTIVQEVTNELPRLEESAREILLRTLPQHCAFLFRLNKDDRIRINIQVNHAKEMLDKEGFEGLQEPYKWMQAAYMRYLGEEILSYLKENHVHLGTLTKMKYKRKLYDPFSVEARDLAEVRHAMETYAEILKDNAAFPERKSECPNCYTCVIARGKVSKRKPSVFKNWKLYWVHDFKKTQEAEGVLGVQQGWYAYVGDVPHLYSMMPKQGFVDAFNDTNVTNAAFLQGTVGMTDPELLALWTDALRDVRTPENCKARTAARVHSHHWWMLFFLSTWMRAHADD